MPSLAEKYLAAVAACEVLNISTPSFEEWEKLQPQEQVTECLCLGSSAVDTITGFDGIVVSIAENIDGTTDMLLQPEVCKENILPDPHWFDSKRLEGL